MMLYLDSTELRLVEKHSIQESEMDESNQLRIWVLIPRNISDFAP